MVSKIGVKYYVLLGIIVLGLLGCAKTQSTSTPPVKKPKPYKVGRKWYKPLSHSKGFKQKGIASWYGSDFHGKKTSNGEIYNMHAITAAHKTLPLGTYVRVYNLENGKTIDVRINDRGPFIRGRIIDLSYEVAKRLDIVEKGTAKVKIVALGKPAGTKKKSEKSPKKYIPSDYYSGTFTFQVGAFKDRENAEMLKQELDQHYKHAHISTFDNGRETYYRVRVGKYYSLEDIIKDEHILIEKGLTEATIIAE